MGLTFDTVLGYYTSAYSCPRGGREDVPGCRRRPERSGYKFWPAPLHNVALLYGDEAVKIGKLLLEYGADPLLTE